MSEADRSVAERTTQQLAGLPDDTLKGMAVTVVGPILAELRRRGVSFSVGTDGVDGAHHPNASIDKDTAAGLIGNTVRTHTGR